MSNDIMSLLGGMKRPTGSERLVQGLLGYERPSLSMEPMAQNMLGYQPSSMEMNPLARTVQPSMMDRVSSGLGGIGSAFSGPGSNARLQALAASLLTGPSRTPISFGSQLAKGLLAGSQAAQAEQDRLLKRSLLEREIAATERDLDIKEAKTGLLSGDIYNVVGGDGKVIKQVIGGTQSYLDAVNDPNTTLSKIGTYSEKPTDVKGYDVYQLQEDGSTKIIGTFSASEAQQFFGKPGYRVAEMGSGLKGGISDGLSGIDLSKDARLLPDGKVEIAEGSPTAIRFGLEKDKLVLEREKFNELMRENQVQEALQEKKYELDKSKVELDYKEFQQRFDDAQKLEERQAEEFFSSTWNIANQTDLIIKKAEEFGPENVFGPASVVGGIPVVGASTAQGEIMSQIQELQSKLVKQALDDFRKLSKQGATGFGQLSEKELQIVMNKFLTLNLQRAPQEILKDLKDLSNEMKSIAYGVVVDGKFENYKPSKHLDLISSGRAVPATPENKKFVGAPKGPEGTVFDTFLNGNPVFFNPKTNKRFTTVPSRDNQSGI